jgi:protein AaeX
MLSEVDVGGIYVAPIVVYAAAAIPLFLILRWVLGHLGVLRTIWHPALFELAVYVTLLSLLILLI